MKTSRTQAVESKESTWNHEHTLTGQDAGERVNGRRKRTRAPSRPPSPPTPAAVGYCRRSTDRQEQSIGDQQEAIKRYCAERGLRLLRFYIDDGISGTSTAGRQAFQRLMADAQSSSTCDFSSIVVYDVKRFGRVDNDEAGYFRHLLRQAGVQVHYATENFGNDGTDDLLRPVKQWQARQESKDLSKVTIRGLVSKSTRGHWMGGAPPYGYDLRYESGSGEFICTLRYRSDGSKLFLNESGKVIRTLERGATVGISKKDHCTLVLSEPDRVATIRRIFKMYVDEGRGFKAIADQLNRDGVPTARGPLWADHFSGSWALTTVRAILVNPVYAGDLVWNRRTDARFHKIKSGMAIERPDVTARRLELNHKSDWVIVKDGCPAIVSRRVFETAQSILNRKPSSKSQRGTNPRTGRAAIGSGPSVPPREFRTVGGWTGPRARFLLSKLITCARCGSRYEGYTQRGRSNTTQRPTSKVYCYGCGGYIRHGRSVCELGSFPQEELEDLVIKAVIKHYERYTKPGGEALLAGAIRDQYGKEADEVSKAAKKAEARLTSIDGTVRKLLDNLGPATKEMIERRVIELDKERAELQERVESLERLAIGKDELQGVIKDAMDFIKHLEGNLREGSLGDRQVAMRKCVKSLALDSGTGKLQLSAWVVPGDAWSEPFSLSR